MNNAFRKEPDAEKPHVRNSVRDTFGNGCIYSTRKHEEMGCICFENPAMGIYFINDPDGYWLEIVPEKLG